MKESLGLFSVACKDFGLTIGTKKTEVMYQPAPAVPYTEPLSKWVGKSLLWQISSVTLATLYQGLTPSVKRLTTKLHCKCGFWQTTSHCVGIRLQTKVKVFFVVILPSLLYASKMWTVCICCAKQLNILLHEVHQEAFPHPVVLQDSRYKSPPES